MQKEFSEDDKKGSLRKCQESAGQKTAILTYIHENDARAVSHDEVIKET